MKRFIGILGIYLGLISSLAAQSQFQNFDSVLLANTERPWMKRDSQLTYIKNHKIVAVLPPAIERFRGQLIRKPRPYDSTEWLPTVLGIQELTVASLLDKKTRYKHQLEIQPIHQTNFILDSLLRNNPLASDTIIAQALGVDGLIITRQIVYEPTTGSYAAAGGWLLLNVILGGGSGFWGNSLPETKTELHYYLKDVATMNSIWHNYEIYEREFVNVQSDRKPFLDLDASPLKTLPYITKDYRIKNKKVRTVVNTTVYLLFGALVIGSYVFPKL